MNSNKNSAERNVVTGAFGYSGHYIAQKLLEQGKSVTTLTNSTERQDPLRKQIEVAPFHFDEPEKLTESLRGVTTLYNTYWVRFNHRTFTHSDAVANTKTLFQAARDAGVERVVHISITNPSLDSPLEYFRGKAELEQTLTETGMSYAILRPAILFGREDILINNIAWMLRRLPIIGVFGDGKYKLQPIYVDDLADLAVQQGALRENATINAIGPETFTYRELVQTIGEIIGRQRPVIGVPKLFGYAVTRCLGLLLRDVIITREEIEGLMNNLLYVDSPPAGVTRLTDWARERAASLGRSYTSELARRRDRVSRYRSN